MTDALESQMLYFLKSILAFLMNMIQLVIYKIFDLFPDGSSFPTIPTPDSFGVDHEILSMFIKTLSWVLPIQFMISCVLAASAAYFFLFAISPALRFFKLKS